MTIIRKNSKIRAVQAVEDQMISWEAVGIYWFLETHLTHIGYDLDEVVSQLLKHSKDTEKNIHKYLNELEKYGYVRIDEGSK